MGTPVVRRRGAAAQREPQVVAAASEVDDLRLALERDEAAWRRLAARYDEPLRTVVREAAEAHGKLAEDHVDDVMGDFWLTTVAQDMRLLRAFKPERGSSLLTWLTFHVAQTAHEHVRRAGEEPAFVSLRAARHVALPPAPPARLRNEPRFDSIEDAIRTVVREAIAAERRDALRAESSPRGPSIVDDDAFISIERAASIADVHPGSRSYMRAKALIRHRKSKVESPISWLVIEPPKRLNS